MRGTAWPNGAYRQHQAYEDGAPRVPVETISGVLHIRDTVFGHKWVYKLNETRRGAKLVFKRRFSISYFVGVAAALAVCIVGGLAVIFSVFGTKYLNNLSSSENNTFTKLTSTIYNNKTKIVFRIHTTSNLTRHKNTSIETKIVREETIKLPVEGTIITEKDNLHNSTCDKCSANEICFQNTSTPYPECIINEDKDDPTGCGGLCKLEVQFCKKLDSTLNIFSCIDIKTVICTEGFWKCENSLMCIADEKKCDGVIHCFDKSDETNCDCDLKNNFHCGENISCIPFSKKCDGAVDCWDASDEKNCTKECEPLFVPCSIGECIPNEKFCDGQFDCEDKSDEPIGCFNNNSTNINR